jgi:hypothetical protein
VGVDDDLGFILRKKVIVTLWDDGLVHWDEHRLIYIMRVGSYLDDPWMHWNYVWYNIMIHKSELIWMILGVLD